MKNIIENELNEHLKAASLLHNITDLVAASAKLCKDCINNGGKILLFGNGGSASDAQHIAAELVGRFKIERKGLSAIALNTDTSVITSISNDYGYHMIFSRQIEAIANKGDVVIGLSTSGSSKNVVNALKLASKMGCRTIAFSGKKTGIMNEVCDLTLNVPSNNTPRIQELHIILGHVICHLIDQNFKTN
jgi:D-sedoheptulose 7-phosphate isomerase